MLWVTDVVDEPCVFQTSRGACQGDGRISRQSQPDWGGAQSFLRGRPMPIVGTDLARCSIEV